MTYRVMTEGTVLPGFVVGDVRPRLAALVNRSEEIAGRLLSGRASTVKSGVDQATAMRYLNALTVIGVGCRIELESMNIDVPDPKAPVSDRSPPSMNRGYMAKQNDTPVA